MKVDISLGLPSCSFLPSGPLLGLLGWSRHICTAWLCLGLFGELEAGAGCRLSEEMGWPALRRGSHSDLIAPRPLPEIPGRPRGSKPGSESHSQGLTLLPSFGRIGEGGAVSFVPDFKVWR